KLVRGGLNCGRESRRSSLGCWRFSCLGCCTFGRGTFRCWSRRFCASNGGARRISNKPAELHQLRIVALDAILYPRRLPACSARVFSTRGPPPLRLRIRVYILLNLQIVKQAGGRI